MGFTAFLAQISPCFQYMFNPFLGSTLSSLSLLHSWHIPAHPFLHIFSFQHFTLHTRFHFSTVLLRHASAFKLPSRRPVTITWSPESVWKRRSYKVSASFPAHSKLPAHLCTHTNLQAYSHHLGIHVKKCWLLLESTEKHLRRAIWSRQVRIWGTPLLQHGGSHAEETTSFATGTGQGEGWRALQSTANVSLPQCYWFEKPQQSKETRIRSCQPWNSLKN